MFFLRKELFKLDWLDARQERRDHSLLLFQKVPSEQPNIRPRFAQAQVDSVLREERERPLTDQKTFAFLKPDTVKNRLIGEVLSRLETKGFAFRSLKLHQITNKEAEALYSVHKGKPFFKELVDHVTSGPVVLMVLQSPNAVDTLRKFIGATDPLKAEPGTIRGDLSVSITGNVIHASDSFENARKESSIFSLDVA